MTKEDGIHIARIEEEEEILGYENSLENGITPLFNYTYFILEIEKKKYIKIGSSIKPDKRVKALQGANARRLELIYKTSKVSENTLQYKFRDDLERGEWYRYGPQIKDFLRRELIKKFNRKLSYFNIQEIKLDKKEI